MPNIQKITDMIHHSLLLWEKQKQELLWKIKLLDENGLEQLEKKLSEEPKYIEEFFLRASNKLGKNGIAIMRGDFESLRIQSIRNLEKNDNF